MADLPPLPHFELELPECDKVSREQVVEAVAKARRRAVAWMLENGYSDEAIELAALSFDPDVAWRESLRRARRGDRDVDGDDD